MRVAGLIHKLKDSGTKDRVGPQIEEMLACCRK